MCWCLYADLPYMVTCVTLSVCCHCKSSRVRCKWATAHVMWYSTCWSPMHCLYSHIMLAEPVVCELVGVRGKLAALQSFSWCVKLRVTTIGSIARLVLVGGRISWHAASETVSHSAPCLPPHCSCQLAHTDTLRLHPAEVSNQTLASTKMLHDHIGRGIFI